MAGLLPVLAEFSILALLRCCWLLNQPEAIAFVQSNLRVLNVESIQTIMVYNRQQGETDLNWQQIAQLHFFSSPADSSLNPSLLDSSPSDLPLSRRDSVTQASDFFPESLQPTSMPPAASPRVNSPATNSALTDAGDFDPSSDSAEETPEILKRPESVIFLIFVSLLVFWDAYVDFLEDSFSPDTRAISASQLARRLKVSRKTIRRRKREPDFSTWTQSLDPEQMSWVYRKGYYTSQP
jgi:hypothetical protein